MRNQGRFSITESHRIGREKAASTDDVAALGKALEGKDLIIAVFR